MAKKITFGANLKDKKNKKIASEEADNWVEGVDQQEPIGEEKVTSKKKETSLRKTKLQDEEKLVKFTIDIPISLRTKIKTKCAIENVPMRERVQKLLEDYFD